MKKAIWVFVLFLLALPFVFAKPPFLSKYGNETTGGYVTADEKNFSRYGGTAGSISEGNFLASGVQRVFYINNISYLPENNYSCSFSMAANNLQGSYAMMGINSNSTSVGTVYVWTIAEQTPGNDILAVRRSSDVTYSTIPKVTDDGTWHQWQITFLSNGTLNITINGSINHHSLPMPLSGANSGYTQFIGLYTDQDGMSASMDNFTCYNGTRYPSVSVPDTTPPSITYYNLTTDSGCENWNTNKNNACSTSSATPTVQFNTNENAWCAIAGGSSSTSLNLNYTGIGSSRNCTGAASGEGSTSHLCTLISQDELVYDTSYLFISCKDTNNNQNLTSTSSALKLSITGLEAAGRTSIGLGIQNALLSGYTNYTDLQIYARSLNNSQVRGTFDKAAKKGSRIWAFNRIGISDSHVNMFNLTPVLYTLEFANKTSSNITLQVEQLINATK